MSILWKQLFSGRFKLVLLGTLVLCFVFVGLVFYVSSKDDLPTRTVAVTATTAPSVPVIDQDVAKETEFALFALG